MWFKNLIIYRFTSSFSLSAEDLSDKLGQHRFKPCSSQQPSSCGWVSPLGTDESPLVHAANGYLMLCLQREDKVLPGAVVKEALEEKLAAIKNGEERTPGRKERLELKEQVIFELLPRAFSRSSKLYAYIDPKAGLLVINSSSHSRAEELLKLLRETLGSLPVIPLKAKNQAEHSMTHWLKEATPPQGFQLGGDCELKDSGDDKGAIRCKNQVLDSTEINNHLKAGMHVSKLELCWDGGIEFLIDAKLAVKRLKFTELITDKLNDVAAESAAEQFDVDFALMTGEFANLIPALLDAFGGENPNGEQSPAKP